MSKLTELKKEIQQLRPEIMELKFGCQLLERSINAIHTIYEFLEGICIETDLENINIDRFFQTKNYKILGRPITLEDVLAVLYELYKYGNDYPNYAFRMLKDWSLGQPLDYQSEETINFLHSIICK